MEFSYRIGEDEYVRACRIAVKSNRKSSGLPVVKTILFWVFVVICLVLLFSVVERSARVSSTTASQAETQADSDCSPAPIQSPQPVSGWSLATNLVPLVAIVAIMGFLYLVWLPKAQRRQYRKDTNLHGETTIALDDQSVLIRSTVGTSFQAAWRAFSNWEQKQNMVLLRFPSGGFSMINISGLSNVEREQLRGILSEALPEKR
jgi:uncharacterized membrane protein